MVRSSTVLLWSQRMHFHSRDLCLFLGCVWVLAATVTAAPSKPHIVLILADDLGYGDLKAFNPNSKIPTPHLDQLAQAGMCLTDAHAGGSTCRTPASPSHRAR